METRKKISVAICTYNGEKYIKEQLESISNQTILPDEVIICDDSSQDATVEEINNFLKNKRLDVNLYINIENVGLPRNFEKVLSLCSGDVIFISDQDDYWDKNKVETVLKIFEKNNNILGVTHDGRIVDSNRLNHGTTKQSQIKKGYGNNYKTITGCLSAIKKDVKKLILPFPAEIRSHDSWINYVFHWFPEYWLISSKSLQEIRRHSENSSEWVVNSFKEINKLDVLKSQIKSKVADNYEDRKEMNVKLTEILYELEGILDKNIKEKAIIKLKFELEAIKNRTKLVNNKRKNKKIFMALKMIIIGDYKYFNGFKSFLRDIMR